MLLRLFVIVFAAATATATMAAETYQNAVFGVQVTKPDSWQVMNGTSDGVTRLERDKALLAQAIKLHLNGPLVELAKYREPFADVSPSFDLAIADIGENRALTGSAILNKYDAQFSSGFVNLVVEQAARDVVVGERPAGYMRFRHLADVEKVGRVEVATEFWAIPRGDFFILIVASTRADEKTGARAEIDRIIQTVRFVD